MTWAVFRDATYNPDTGGIGFDFTTCSTIGVKQIDNTIKCTNTWPSVALPFDFLEYDLSNMKINGYYPYGAYMTSDATNGLYSSDPNYNLGIDSLTDPTGAL